MKLYKYNTGTLKIAVRERLSDAGLKAFRFRASDTETIPVLTFGCDWGESATLIDAGLGSELLPMGLFSTLRYRPKPTPMPTIFNPATTDVALTHLDTDHIGHLKTLPRRELVYSSAERVTGWARKRLNGPSRLLTESMFLSGLFPFPSIDIYGDGRLYALSTPGHSRGHLCFYCEWKGFGLLFCGDAFESLEALYYTPEHGEAYMKTVRRIREWFERDEKLILLACHDMQTEKLLPNGELDTAHFETLSRRQRDLTAELKLVGR